MTEHRYVELVPQGTPDVDASRHVFDVYEVTQVTRSKRRYNHVGYVVRMASSHWLSVRAGTVSTEPAVVIVEHSLRRDALATLTPLAAYEPAAA